MSDATPFSPLAKKNLGKSICSALLANPILPLPPARFKGAGIYALYYAGDFAPYEPISAKNRANKWQQPIYVGEALPKGARKGGVGLDVEAGALLYGRLRKHARSIDASIDLKLDHFRCRYLILEDVWIPLGESNMIQQYSPLWNRLLDGFGNNAPGRGRKAGRRSAWDTFHAGRAQAIDATEHDRSHREILAAVEQFLATGAVNVHVKKMGEESDQEDSES